VVLQAPNKSATPIPIRSASRDPFIGAMITWVAGASGGQVAARLGPTLPGRPWRDEARQGAIVEVAPNGVSAYRHYAPSSPNRRS
jgi:hypothetical protein